MNDFNNLAMLAIGLFAFTPLAAAILIIGRGESRDPAANVVPIEVETNGSPEAQRKQQQHRALRG